jgi:cyclopropane fatty-acyl-phospholipid synthase-like methyltransferase
VHYHTGLVDRLEEPTLSTQALRQRLIAAQERMLLQAASAWQATSTLCGDVLDVGCGLGGGAIFWAQEFGARVTAVTCVPSHVNWITEFAAQAGVTSRVRPLLCDALEVAGENCFDAAVAVDSSGYLPRREWFGRVSSLLRQQGRVFIVDCVINDSEFEEPFNQYWHTHIGTLAEYLAEAQRAGLLPEMVEDLSSRTRLFWTTTLELIQPEVRERTLSPIELARSEASRRAHELVRRGLTEGGLRYLLMSFSKVDVRTTLRNG